MTFYSKLLAKLPRIFGIRTQLRRALTAVLPEAVEESLGHVFEEIAISRLSRRGAKALRQLNTADGLKLHLGCGDDVRVGWTNIDMHVRVPDGFDPTDGPNTRIIDYDLRQGLPLSDASCRYIYSSHFFEHLEWSHGLALMQDCRRVLRPGGIFRVSLPNFEIVFAAYVAKDRQFFRIVEEAGCLPECKAGTRSMTEYINYAVYQFGEHKCIHDEETVVSLLKRIGFSTVDVSEFNQDIDPNDEIRARYSYYVEAVK